MKPNVGGFDRWARILGGIVLLALALFHAVAGSWLIAAYVVGTIGLLTGLAGFCPAYRLVRLDTHGIHHA